MSGAPSSRTQVLAGIAALAGAEVMRYYGRAEARLKDDRSPVTDADQAAEALILAELARAFPGIPVVAEEEAAAGRIAKVSSRFFLVDPLDGTREFLSGNGEFTVNIAEVVDGVPVAGAVHAPARDRMFLGAAEEGAFETTQALAGFAAIAARHAPATGLIAVGSRSHNDAQTDAFLKRFDIAQFVAAGSSLKFCLLAAGEADLYARHGRTMEWDTAAGHAVLNAAGGSVTRWDGTALLYGKPGFENPPFIAKGIA